MVKATFDVLSEADKKLLLETEPKKLKKLDEDGLVELHARVRRSRNRHIKTYRRDASEQVKADRARGMASKKSRRSSARAEVMEDALARVSRVLADRAEATAEALRNERIELARTSAKGKAARQTSTKSKGKAGGPAAKSSKAKPKAKAKVKKSTPASKKARASTRAAGKRAQAKRDSR